MSARPRGQGEDVASRSARPSGRQESNPGMRALHGATERERERIGACGSHCKHFKQARGVTWTQG